MEDITNELVGSTPDPVGATASDQAVPTDDVPKPAPSEIAPVEDVPHLEQDPAELQLLDFQQSITATVNNYLQHNSAIFIVSFMEQVASDVEHIANNQRSQLYQRFRSK